MGRVQQRISRRKRLIAIYGSRCFYCGAELEATQITIDHYIPRCKGGTNDIENLRPSCEKCNHEKDDELPTDALVLYSESKRLAIKFAEKLSSRVLSFEDKLSTQKVDEELLASKSDKILEPS